jgi:hypothetical protein
MNNNSTAVRTSLTEGWKPALLAAALLSLMAAWPALGGKANLGNPGIIPPQAVPFGQTYGEWGAKWWQWALSIPAASNPVADTTGEFAAVGQSGPVWFLAGDFGGAVVRTITVPAGKGLFFPILNQSIFWYPANDPNDPVPPLDQPYFDGSTTWPTMEAFIRALAAGTIDNAVGLACEIDGRSVKNLQAYRCQSPVFMGEFPEGNLFGYDVAVDGTTYGPAVDDGIYLMLAPLSAGKHTIRVMGGSGPSFRLEVTYHLTVK